MNRFLLLDTLDCMDKNNVHKSLVSKIVLLLILSSFIVCCHKESKSKESLAKPTELYTFAESIQDNLKGLAEIQGYEILHTIDTHTLFSYLSGRYKGSHKFPAIFFDPENNTFTVTSQYIQERFLFDQFNIALHLYKEILVEKGYEIEGEVKDNNIYVEVDGRQMVALYLADLFPNTEEAMSHFTSEQYDFVYRNLGGWQGFSYLSGVGDTGRDFPLMVGVGFMDTARLRVLGKGLAHEFRFSELETAFTTYRAYIEERTKN